MKVDKARLPHSVGAYHLIGGGCSHARSVFVLTLSPFRSLLLARAARIIPRIRRLHIHKRRLSVGNDMSAAIGLPVPDPYGDDVFYESQAYELTAGDRGYFRLVVEQSQNLSIATFGDADTYGQLLDAMGNVLVEDANEFVAHSNNFFLYCRRLAPGTYYLVVQGAAKATGFYTVGLFSSPSSLAPKLTPPWLNGCR